MTVATHPAAGDVYRHTSTGDRWRVIAASAHRVSLEGTRPIRGTDTFKFWVCPRARFDAELTRVAT